MYVKCQVKWSADSKPSSLKIFTSFVFRSCNFQIYLFMKNTFYFNLSFSFCFCFCFLWYLFSIQIKSINPLNLLQLLTKILLLLADFKVKFATFFKLRIKNSSKIANHRLQQWSAIVQLLQPPPKPARRLVFDQVFFLRKNLWLRGKSFEFEVICRHWNDSTTFK